MLKFKIVRWVAGVTAGILALYGIGHWGFNMGWVLSVDQWLLNKNISTTLLVIFACVITSFFFIPGALRFYKQHLVIIENKHLSSTALPQMSVHEIAEYLLTKSSWGRATLRRINLIEFVKAAVADEMTAAGISGGVRYIGSRPNSRNVEEIDRTYWRQEFIDELRVWDSRNARFTTNYSNYNTAYEYGTAPRVDVERAWPKASILSKIYTPLYLVMKIRIWYPIKSKFQNRQNQPQNQDE